MIGTKKGVIAPGWNDQEKHMRIQPELDYELGMDYY